MTQTLPPPACKWGYTDAQLKEILGNKYAEFNGWMAGQTVSLCQGREYDHDKKEYVISCDGVSHGAVVYAWDLDRFLRGLPVID